MFLPTIEWFIFKLHPLRSDCCSRGPLAGLAGPQGRSMSANSRVVIAMPAKAMQGQVAATSVLPCERESVVYWYSIQ